MAVLPPRFVYRVNADGPPTCDRTSCGPDRGLALRGDFATVARKHAEPHDTDASRLLRARLRHSQPGVLRGAPHTLRQDGQRYVFHRPCTALVRRLCPDG